ncbi:class I SAM-dependent methyltransferase [bacterium]|nr:class I SAM-dependent methyltransferase [bacterium]NUN46742.1 class I SAM-dependent methyltransferase [bacterium]
MFRRVRKFFGKAPVQLNPKEAYNLWSESYDTERNPVKSFSDNMVSEYLPEMKDKALLDVGCGTGHACKLALDHGAARVLGLDISENMIIKARKLIPSDKAEFRTISEKQSFVVDEPFDVAVCALVLAHTDDPNLILHSIYDALRPDGILIITDFHPHAAHQGMKRSFDHHGVTYTVTHHTHTLETYRGMLEDTGFTCLQHNEASWLNTPVVFAMQCQKK